MNGFNRLFSSFSNKDTSTQSLNLTSRCTSQCYEKSSHGTAVLPCPARVLSFNIMIMCTRRCCTFCKACFSSGGLAQHCGASYTQHHGLSMAEHCGDLIATCRHRGQMRFSTKYPPKVSLFLQTASKQVPRSADQCYLDIWHPWSKSSGSGPAASSYAASSPPPQSDAASLSPTTKWKLHRDEKLNHGCAALGYIYTNLNRFTNSVLV